MRTIAFGCSGTIPISVNNGPLVIATNLTLDGNGQQVTLDGGGMQVLSVNSGVSFTLNALAIAHGWADSGGGLLNYGTVNISNSTFANNGAPGGGGLYNYGTVSISNSIVANNGASVVGGGLVNIGTVSISNSIVANNSG